MAELGIASGIAGLISLGITICKGIVDYYDAFKGSREEVDQMCASVGQVGKILLVIYSTLKRGTFEKTISDVVETSIVSCASGLEALRKRLEKVRASPTDGTFHTKLRNAGKRAAYPFKESTLVKMREICDELKDNLDLAMNALHINAVVVAQERFGSLMHISSVMSNDIQGLAKEVSAISLDAQALRSEQDDEFMAKIYAWLTPLTTVFQNKHRESLTIQVRQDNGARELIQRPEFLAWISSTGTVLWCRGSPGIGKTVNVSYIIDHLEQKRREDDFGLAYVYFSYKDAGLQTPVNIMASILQQLVLQRPNFMSDLRGMYTKHSKENSRPSVGDITTLIQSITYSFPKILIVIDALDECANTDDVRAILLTEIKKLQNSCLLVMSRPIPDLDDLLEGAIRIRIEASSTDIKNYLQQRLESTRSMQKHLAEEPGLLNTIVSRIELKIKGMFLMARLYLDTLIHKTTRRKIKAALDTLPDGMDSIYEELMTRIKLQNPKDHTELAIRVLGWIFYSFKPLTVTELQHALAIEHGDTDLDEDGIPNRDLLVSVCAGIVMIDDNSDTITLVHYTTQEYFQRSGSRLLYHANRDIAQACLTYLQFDAFKHPIEDLANYDAFATLLRGNPLLIYAAQHWGDHLRDTCDDITTAQAMVLLSDHARVHLISWVKDYADNLAKGTYFRPRSRVPGLSLVSAFGLSVIVSEMIKKGSSVSVADSRGQTALHRAVDNGHINTTEVLLRGGADVNTRDLSGWTALHQASRKADESLARLLLNEHAEVDVVDGYGATPLYRAAEAGSEIVVKLLLYQHANVLTRNSYLQAALHRAADNGHYAVVDLLLKHGADANAKDHYGYTPFYRAADQGHEDVSKLLWHHMLQNRR